MELPLPLLLLFWGFRLLLLKFKFRALLELFTVDDQKLPFVPWLFRLPL